MAGYDNNLEDQEKELNPRYSPGKKTRAVRKRVYSRYYAMRDDPLRKDAEKDWEEGDKAFRMYIPTPDPDDWRSHLVLPDAFSAVQADAQERIDRKSRPYLKRVEDSDKGIERFNNAILNHNLDRTGFDFQYFLAKYSAAIRGTAFLYESYRVDKRDISDPTGVNEDGTLEYTQKEVVDYDDSYTGWEQNEFIFLDNAASHIDECRDMVKREILPIAEFNRVYAKRADFIDVDKVTMGGDLSRKAFFRMPTDLHGDEVEILHYFNRAIDEYAVVANNVVVRMGPIPFKHKELPIAVVYHYFVPGRVYGMGIPRVIFPLTEERRSIRNLNLDRQKMQINKMFLVNDQMDFDEEEAVTRPHGFIEVQTNGVPLRDAIVPLEYGDVPASYFRTEEILLEDIRRAHGIDDRIQGNSVGGTATEAAILKESSLKRVNLIAQLAEMDPLIRIGRLKWSNIQFFYPAPRIERITEENDEREKKTYRKITVEGQEFTIVKDTEGKKSIKVNEIEGSHTFKLNPAMARFLEGDVDVTVDASAQQVLSKPIQQAKVTEAFTAIMANPITAAVLDPEKAVRRYLDVNQENPDDWTKVSNNEEDTQQVAEWENMVMSSGQPLDATEDANTEHTLIHLHFTETKMFDSLPQPTQAIIMNHIMKEHDANPTTGSSADALAGGVSGGATSPPAAGISPQIQPADLTPSTVTGEAPNSGQNQTVALQ